MAQTDRPSTNEAQVDFRKAATELMLGAMFQAVDDACDAGQPGIAAPMLQACAKLIDERGASREVRVRRLCRLMDGYPRLARMLSPVADERFGRLH